jgi:hypothetical protein
MPDLHFEVSAGASSAAVAVDLAVVAPQCEKKRY